MSDDVKGWRLADNYGLSIANPHAHRRTSNCSVGGSLNLTVLLESAAASPPCSLPVSMSSVNSLPYDADVKSQILEIISAGLSEDEKEKQIMALVGGKQKVETQHANYSVDTEDGHTTKEISRQKT